MGDRSDIEWTDATWNPVVGCSRVSAGCQNCYAERVAHRGMAEQHRGLTIAGEKAPRWNGQVRFVPHVLDKPLRWTKPRRVFVNSLSDLFHEGVSNEQIAAVFGVMAGAPQHTFQVLTKRPERMAEWFRWAESNDHASPLSAACEHAVAQLVERCVAFQAGPGLTWPLPNVWLGVSVEDQATAEERVPLLLNTPAALRWVSYEPALGPVRFEALVDDEIGASWNAFEAGLHWVVVGGESGPSARPFNIKWAMDTVRSGANAGVPVFVKQLGSQPRDGALCVPLRDRKGGDWDEWPEDLRVREMPEPRS